MNLKTKIRLFSSIFMLVLIVLVNTSIYYLFYKISSTNELDQLSVQTDSIVETYHTNRDIPPNQLLKPFVPTNGIIRIIDKSGKEQIITLTKHPEYRELEKEYSERETRKIIKDKSGAHIAVISKPIIWENGEVVTLQVANYLISLEETMRTLLYVLIVASMIILIPSIIAGNLLSKFVLQPITELIETMKENTRQAKWKTIDLENKSKDELYEMKETFNEMIKHLKVNFERQEVFVSDASHELKTPISIIKSYAQLLKRRGKSHPEVFEESIDAIETETERMQQLVNQMLILAKNKASAPFQPIDIKSLTIKVMKTFTHAYGREINLEAEAGTFFVLGNEEQLEQIIYILLDNAIKYSHAEINVTLAEKNGSLYVHVIDKGSGISYEDQQHLFERFYRVDKARTRTSGGTGLGLAIAKAITESHNGKLTVKSEIGKGSTFTVKLPIVKNS